MAIAAILLGAGCRAQQPQRSGVKPVHLRQIGGYVEFIARQREREQRSKVGAGDTSYKETIFEERIKLETEGYVYHPNFLEFSLGGLFGLLQHDYEDNFGGRQRTSSDDGDIVEFDINGHFFKKKKYPGTIFARRYESLEPRPFLPSLRTTTTNFGLVWQYVSEKTPTSLQFTHTDVKLDPLSKDEADGRQKNTNLRFNTEYRFSDSNVLSFTYDRDSIEQQPFNLDYDTDEFTLAHTWGFGSRKQHRLDSELNYYRQKGTFDIERARWREILRLSHTENLKSWYQWELADRTQGSLLGVPPIEERSYYLSGTLEHQLYESLQTQLYGFARRQDFGTGARIDRYGFQASWDYRKKNPLGVLLANYRVRLQQEERTGGDVLAEVVDERRTFNDPEPIVLNTANINTGSIVITSVDTLTFYTVGRDYNVRRVGETVEIERVVTGQILDGQVVLIDYTFNLGGDFVLDTVGQDFGIRQDFSFGLSPYYRLRWQDQTITPADATGAVAEDITGQILGLEFRRGSLRLIAEYEDFDSNIRPFEAVRLTGDYTHRFKFGATGVIKARWADFQYKPPIERDTRFFTVEGRYRHPITPHLTVEGAVLYRDVKDSLSGDDTGVDVDLSLEWLIRKTEVRATYEYGKIDDDFAESDYSSLYVQVRRRF